MNNLQKWFKLPGERMEDKDEIRALLAPYRWGAEPTPGDFSLMPHGDRPRYTFSPYGPEYVAGITVNNDHGRDLGLGVTVFDEFSSLALRLSSPFGIKWHETGNYVSVWLRPHNYNRGFDSTHVYHVHFDLDIFTMDYSWDKMERAQTLRVYGTTHFPRAWKIPYNRLSEALANARS